MDERDEWLRELRQIAPAARAEADQLLAALADECERDPRCFGMLRAIIRMCEREQHSPCRRRVFVAAVTKLGIAALVDALATREQQRDDER